MTHHLHNRPPANYRASERGNVLFYIFIAIALIAALSFAVSNSGRSTGGGLDDERASLFAGELLDYSNIIGNAVAQLRLRGCQIGEISFDNNSSTDFVNGTAPADSSCHVFQPNGGGAVFQNIERSAFNSNNPGYTFDAGIGIQNIGTTCANASCSDLLFIARDVRVEICTTLNDVSAVTNPSDIPPADTGVTFTPFTGAYTAEGIIGDETSSADIAGRKSGCYLDNASGEYNFYKVLIAR